MNSVQVLGNLVRDPEVRFTKTGRAVATFTVAVTRSFSAPGSQETREATDYIPVVAWGNLAEICGNNLAKGTRVFVEGRFQTRSYETPEGQKRYVSEVVANFVAQTMGYGKDTKPAMPAADSFGGFGKEAGDEEIPF